MFAKCLFVFLASDYELLKPSFKKLNVHSNSAIMIDNNHVDFEQDSDMLGRFSLMPYHEIIKSDISLEDSDYADKVSNCIYQGLEEYLKKNKEEALNQSLYFLSGLEKFAVDEFIDIKFGNQFKEIYARDTFSINVKQNRKNSKAKRQDDKPEQVNDGILDFGGTDKDETPIIEPDAGEFLSGDVRDRFNEELDQIAASIFQANEYENFQFEQQAPEDDFFNKNTEIQAEEDIPEDTWDTSNDSEESVNTEAEPGSAQATEDVFDNTSTEENKKESDPVCDASPVEDGLYKDKKKKKKVTDRLKGIISGKRDTHILAQSEQSISSSEQVITENSSDVELSKENPNKMVSWRDIDDGPTVEPIKKSIIESVQEFKEEKDYVCTLLLRRVAAHAEKVFIDSDYPKGPYFTSL